MRSRLLLPLLAVLATLLVRTLVALSRVDELELERYSANLAWALLQGLPLDPEQLPIISHLRGSFLFGLALVPVVAVCGPTLLALRVVALAWSALAAGLAAALAERHLGRVGALATLLLVAAAPPAFQMVDVLAMGSHADTIPTLLLPLLLALRLDPSTTLRHRAAFGLGLACGSAVLFSYQALVALPGVLLVVLLRQPLTRARLARLPAAVLGFALAAAPIPFLSRDAKVANHAVLDDVGAFDASASAAKFASALTHDLPQSWGYGAQGLAPIAVLVALVALAGWCTLALRRPHTRAAWRSDGARQLLAAGLVHVLALLAAYAVVDLEADLSANLDGMAGRYFHPLWPAFAFACAGACQFVAERGVPRAGLALAVVVALASGAATLRFLEPSKAFAQPSVSALEFYAFRSHVAHASRDANEQLDWLERLDPSWRDWWPFHHLTGELAPGRTPEEFAARLGAARTASPRLVPFLCVTAGARAATRVTSVGAPPSQWPAAIAREAEPFVACTASAAERRWFWRGVGRTLATSGVAFEVQVRWGRADASAPSDLLRGLERFGEDATAVCEGLGFQLGLRASPYQPPEPALLARSHLVAPRLRQVLARAVGWGYRVRFVEDAFRVPVELSFERVLPSGVREAFRAGLADQAGPP
jgi:hypothetical protein